MLWGSQNMVVRSTCERAAILAENFRVEHSLIESRPRPINEPAPLPEISPRGPGMMIQHPQAFVGRSLAFVADHYLRKEHRLRNHADATAEIEVFHVQEVSFIKETHGFKQACSHQHETTGEAWHHY